MDPKGLEKRKCWQAALRALARGFSYPDAAWVETLLSGQWPEDFRAVLEPLNISGEGLQEAITALPDDLGEALQALQVEYTRLFINAVPHVIAPPYASAYFAQGMLMNEPAEAALKAYRRAGLELAEDFCDLPDHLAVELEFLSWLEEQTIEAQEKGDTINEKEWIDQKEAFISTQVKPWLAEFVKRVEGSARMAMYPELANLARIVLEQGPDCGPT